MYTDERDSVKSLAKRSLTGKVEDTESVRIFKETLQKHPKSYKHYTITISPVGVLEHLLNSTDSMDAVTKEVCNFIGKGTVCTWVNEIAPRTKKSHIHGVISSRKALEYSSIISKFTGYQVYLTRVKLHRSNVGSINPELFVYNQDGEPIGVSLRDPKTLDFKTHYFKEFVEYWVYYVCKSFNFENKKIKYYRVV